MKENGGNPDNIVQGVDRVTAYISSMHVNHEADKSNRETENNSESDNEDKNNSDPT